MFAISPSSPSDIISLLELEESSGVEDELDELSGVEEGLDELFGVDDELEELDELDELSGVDDEPEEELLSAGLLDDAVFDEAVLLALPLL
ncbi:MAG: hypothetical protein II233_04215 [Clostridia bacterium]|nr:hypothetical protein [Clostridia bacterium]